MAKLRFDSISTNVFSSFKLVPKVKKVRTDGIKKLTTKLVSGLCIKDKDVYKVQLNISALKPDIIDKIHPDILLLEFTERSYELKDVKSVFDRNPNENGKYVRYIRNESHAKFFPGSPERYTPFCNNWVVNGYIVRDNGKMKFDFNDCLYPKGYNVYTKEDDE